MNRGTPMTSETSTAPRQFNLRASFAIGSFGTIAVICLVAALWLSSYMTRSLLAREAEVAQEFLETIVQINGPGMFADDTSERPREDPMLLDFARHVMSMPGMLRVNIHSIERRILWSSDAELIGVEFPPNDELEEAFAGERVVAIIDAEGDDKAEHVALDGNRHYIEVYLPIHADIGGGPVIGVVEFYRLPLSLDALITQGHAVVWIGAAVAALALFLALFGIVQRGARLIERQQQTLGRLEAFSAIGQMASAVAHSLRNPMATIRSSAELLQTSLPPEERQVTREIVCDIDRMDRYVKDLLLYARSEPYHLQPVDPLRVIETILARQSRAAERNGITFARDDRRTGGEKVMADEMLLEQALTSIVTNSIEAMPDGGRLLVSIAPAARAGRTRIRIDDEGTGIPEDVRSRVSQSYFTTKTRGLGLGLVLARSIIERFGGQLDIGSAGKRGTSVQIELGTA